MYLVSFVGCVVSLWIEIIHVGLHITSHRPSAYLSLVFFFFFFFFFSILQYVNLKGHHPM